MNNSDVLVKTAKGAEEIQTRAHGLAQKLRALLIVVDGRQSVATLAQRFSGLGDVEAALAELLAQGFVQAASAQASVAAERPAAAARAVPEETLDQAVRGLCGLLHELLGPDADDFTERLERARSRNEFLAALERAHSMVAGLGGAQKAARLNDRGMTIVKRHFAE
jgi:hypothetical protein